MKNIRKKNLFSSICIFSYTLQLFSWENSFSHNFHNFSFLLSLLFYLSVLKVYFLMRNYHTQTIHLQFPPMNAMRIIFSHILPTSRHSTTSKVSRAVKTKFNFTWMTLSSSFLHHWHQLTTLMLWNCWKKSFKWVRMRSFIIVLLVILQKI